MEIDLSRVRKYWIISFWLLLGWSLIDICIRSSMVGINEFELGGRLVGIGALMGITYACAYKGSGVRSLVYMMAITSLSIFVDLINNSSYSYDVIGMVLNAFIWFTSYRLLLANAVLSFKIKPE